MPSVAILGLLSVGIGIELAVTAFLILRFLESREPQVRWWAVAWGVMGSGFGPLPLPLSTLLAAVALVFSGLVLSGLLFSGSPGWAALPPSLLGGAWFILAALRYVRSVGGLDERSSLLVFGGLLLTGLISLAYPLLRPQQIWLGVGAVLAGTPCRMTWRRPPPRR